MSRYPDRHEPVQEQHLLGRMPLSQGRGPGSGSQEERPRGGARPPRARHRIQAMDRTFRISSDERALLSVVGQFRTIEQADAVNVLYAGDHRRYDSDRLSLARQGLLERKTVLTRHRAKIVVLVLTERGRRLLESSRPPADRQVYFAGLAKPREVVHDASVYRMYEEQKARIEAAGGKVRRVILDYELKRELYRRTSRNVKLPEPEATSVREAAAAELELRVVDGKVPLPDLRLEYETAQGTISKVDLEAVTQHYHRRHMAEKRAAGFSLWSADNSGRKSSVWDDHDLIGEMLDL